MLVVFSSKHRSVWEQPHQRWDELRSHFLYLCHVTVATAPPLQETLAAGPESVDSNGRNECEHRSRPILSLHSHQSKYWTHFHKPHMEELITADRKCTISYHWRKLWLVIWLLSFFGLTLDSCFICLLQVPKLYQHATQNLRSAALCVTVLMVWKCDGGVCFLFVYAAPLHQKNGFWCLCSWISKCPFSTNYASICIYILTDFREANTPCVS